MVLLALHVLASAACQQESEWVELRFHRVHLRNGNFIDGQLLKDTAVEVVLKMKYGNMAIRRDQIDFLEFVKMKSLLDKPIIEKNPPRGPTPASGGTSQPPIPAALDTPSNVREQIDAIVAKLKAAPPGSKKFPIEELRALGEEGALYLVSRFKELPLDLQGSAATALSILKFPKTIPIIEGLLGDPDPRVRATAAMALGFMGEAERSRYLKPMLRDPDSEVRGIILGMLSGAQDKEWFDPVSELCGDADPNVRSQANQIALRLAIEYKLQEVYLRLLADLVRRTGDEVRIDLAGMIGSLGRLEAWTLLTPLLNESEPRLRAAAAMSLARLGAPESGPDILAQVPRERERTVRVQLAGAVQRLRLRKAVRPLIDWLSDSDDEIRKTAASTLSSLTAQKFGLDRDQWQAWADASGE